MKKNILVTGSHRSGSTWTGKVISKAEKIRYVHEPFNLDFDRTNSPISFWFEQMNGSPSDHQKKVKEYINSFFSISHKDNFRRVLGLRSQNDAALLYRDFKGIMTANRTLIKDPLALMSAEWFYDNYGWDIVVLIRHPAAFVASVMVKNWEFDFNNYLKQPQLMNNFLKNYSALIEDYAKNPKDIVDQGILLWNTMYDVVAYYKEKFGDEWYFVRHEDLSANPVLEFAKMFTHLDLDQSDVVKNYIKETTISKEDTSLKRNSLDNIKNWKNRLSIEEIARIKKKTESVWRKFYSEDDW